MINDIKSKLGSLMIVSEIIKPLDLKLYGKINKLHWSPIEQKLGNRLFTAVNDEIIAILINKKQK